MDEDHMIELLKVHLRHLSRSGILWTLLGISFFVEYLGISALKHSTLQWNGVIARFDQRDFLFVGMVLQFGMGVLFSTIFGLWILPHLHRGERVSLTFSLPIPKWKFVLSYLIVYGFIFLVQAALFLGAFFFSFGFDSSKIAWEALLWATLFQWLTLSTLSLYFSMLSLLIGPLSGFFLGSFLMMLSLFAAIVLSLPIEQWIPVQELKLAKSILTLLPPIGEFPQNLRQIFMKKQLVSEAWIKWLFWWAGLNGILIFLLRFPKLSRTSD